MHRLRKAGAGMLDRLELDFYLVLVENALYSKQEKAFQEFFCEIAHLLWGDDFEGRRPQGRLGDKKCDGYRRSTATVFQSYAPRQMQARALEAKIREDFTGAKAHFKGTMKIWTLVHNDIEELPTSSHELIISLRKANPKLVLDIWGPRILRDKILTLSPESLRRLFPRVPSAQELRRVAYREIDELLASIDMADPQPTLEKPVAPSKDKLAHNKLPDHIAALLHNGALIGARFERYLAETSRTEIGNRASDKFKHEYRRRRVAGETPEQIFFGLVKLTGGLDCTPGQQAARFGLLAYLFHSCDVFEDAPRHEAVAL